MKRFEESLPQGYVEAKTIDAKNGKTAVAFTVGSLVLTLAVFVVVWLALFRGEPVADSLDRLVPDENWTSLVRIVVFFAAYLLYVVLHELVHGAVYKAFTKQKLTFGVTLTVAYCGIPNLYVYRTVALCALLAPFVVFVPVFLVPMFLLESYADVLICGALLAFHVGGCIGDLYDAALYAFVFTDKTTLMRDTGPKQTFYVKNSVSENKIVETISEKANDADCENERHSDSNV